MTDEIYATPVITYPGIFPLIAQGQNLKSIPNLGTVESRWMDIESLGESEPVDFPLSYQPRVHTWRMGWSVAVFPVTWTGTASQWTGLSLLVNGITPSGSLRLAEYILPLTEGALGDDVVGASAELKIHTKQAYAWIYNVTGQTQTINWHVWAKAD